MPVDAPEATDSQVSDQSQSPAGDQQSHQPEPVSIATSQSKFAGLASRFFGRPVHVEDGSEGDGEQGEAKDDETRTGDKKDAATDEKVTLTREELRRMVQSEKDKELARDHKSQTDQAEAARLDKLKKEDPYAYIEHEEAAKETGNFVKTIATSYDQALLDPIKARLSAKDQANLLGKDGVVGMEGRKEFVSKALDLLLKQAEDKGTKMAEKRIRGNQALVKQVILGERDKDDEPDLVEGTGVPGSTKVDMNFLMRRAAGR